MIIAYKDGRSKRFSPVAWDLMGRNKNGWSEVETSTTTSNIVTEKLPSAIPPTGEKETLTVQVDENVATPVVVDEIVVVETSTADADFIALAKEHLSKNKIKDLFDAENVAYKTSDNTDALIALLSKHLNADIELLKSKFSI